METSEDALEFGLIFCINWASARIYIYILMGDFPVVGWWLSFWSDYKMYIYACIIHVSRWLHNFVLSHLLTRNLYL